MKNFIKNEKNRLNSMIITDKMNCHSRFSELIKNEVFFVLNNYLDFERKDFMMAMGVDDMGFIDVKIFGKAKRIRSVDITSNRINYND